MARSRLKIALALFSIALVLLGARLYSFYFSGPDAILQRAEAFGFRRMTVAQLGSRSAYRFHYVTNRVADDAVDSLEERFGAERQTALQFGSFDTHIEPSLGIGMLIDPTAWFQNEMIQIDETAALDRSTFVERMRDLVEQSPDRSLLVVVHGFREAFPSALRKTAFLGHVLDINAPILLFDWPGNQGSSLGGYRRARAVAEASGGELAETLELVLREIRPERLWLVANSMGGQVVADAFGILAGKPELADAETEIEHVVLTAPDVDHDEFDARFQQDITALAEKLTVYVSSNDRALLVSRIINWSRRRGESTLSPDQLEEAARIGELVEPGSDRVTLVDVTPVNRTRNFHNFSLETPEFFDDLYLRLSNRRVPRSRLLYPIRTPDGRVYWVLTRGR
jgi:esterase/lipase superfamily enzyme